MKRTNNRTVLALVIVSALSVGAVLAQKVYRYSQTEATTARFDAQRTGWVPLDRFIAPDKMSGFSLQWKTKLDNNSKNGGALSSGVVTGAGLGITLAYIGASDNRTIAVDMDNGFPFFTRVYTGPSPSPTGECLGASLATPTRTTPLTPAVPGPLTLAGQSATGPNAQLPYGSAIGEPGEGIPPVKVGAYFAQQGTFFAPPGAQPYDGTAASAAAGADYVAKAGPARGRGGATPGGAPAAVGAAGRGAASPVNADGGGVPAVAGAPVTPGTPGGPGAAGGPGGPGAAGGRGPVNADGLAGAGRGASAAGGAVGAGGAAAAVGRGGGGGGFGRGGGPTYALSNDGALHALTPSDGLDSMQPMPFLPAGAQATDLIMIDGVVYTSTVNSCGGAPNGVWSIKPAATPAGATFPTVNSWKTGGTASPRMPSFNADGVMFVAVGSGTGQISDSVVSLDPATLSVKSTFSKPGANFTTSPVIFRVDTRDIIAVQGADGRIFLLDGANLSTPLYTSQAVNGMGGYKPTALAIWQDSTGQRWLLSTTPTSVVAYKVTVNGSSASLTEGWTLSGLKEPLAPLVVNGVAFVLSSGEYVPAKGASVSATQIKSRSTPAMLYGVDGVTGKTIWNSGKTIATFVPVSSAVWNSMGQILVGDYDNTLYAFGMAIDRHL